MACLEAAALILQQGEVETDSLKAATLALKTAEVELDHHEMATLTLTKSESPPSTSATRPTRRSKDKLWATEICGAESASEEAFGGVDSPGLFQAHESPGVSDQTSSTENN